MLSPPSGDCLLVASLGKIIEPFLGGTADSHVPFMGQIIAIFHSLSAQIHFPVSILCWLLS
jgi:hypothetical protein